MTSLPRFSVSNPVLVNLFMVTLLAGGAYCGMTLVREMFPESRPNQILIATAYPGATPAEVEKGITLKIEEAIKDVEGVEKVASTTSEGASTIMVELRSGYDDLNQAVEDVKAAVDMIPANDFPEEALETRVMEFEPRFPVVMVSLFGDMDDRTLKRLGERLRNDILELPDVTNILLSGTRRDEISIEVSPAKLVEYSLSFMDVAQTVAAGNFDLPGGLVRTKNANVAVRTLGEKEHGEDLYDLVISGDGSGRLVHLRDVANIIDGFEETEVAGRFQGKPSVSVRVSKTPEQDAIRIAGLVRALVAGKTGKPLERPWFDRFRTNIFGPDEVDEAYQSARRDPYPPGIGVEIHSDLSRYIEGRLDLLKRNGTWGLLLVFLSLLVFLHWRVAFWVMMGLILAVAGALICMKLMGLTLNLITMFGLIIVLGLLVDDAIIVSEHVYSKVEQGVEPKQAAILGTEEVTWPVVCAILTTIVAFVPLMYIEGQMGDWMGVLPMIVCVALAASLAEALMILPSHLAHGLRPLTQNGAAERAFGRSRLGAFLRVFRETEERIVVAGLRRGYEYLLRKATTYRYVVIAGLISCMMIILGASAGGHLPFVFIQKMDGEILMGSLRMAVGAPSAATQRAMGVMERATLALDEHQTIYTISGIELDDSAQIATGQSHMGQAFIELTPSDTRTRSSEMILRELRSKTADIAGVERLKFDVMSGGPGGAPIQIEITGERVEDLHAIATQIKQRLAKFDGVQDINDDFDAGRPEVHIELYESARALGLTTQSLATQVRAAFYGFEAKKIQRHREDVRIMVRYPRAYRERIYDIESMRVVTPSGAFVPFTEVARLKEGTGYSSIKRVNQKRTITVTTDVDTDVTTAEKVIASLRQSFPEITRPYPGVTLAFGGQKLETQKAFDSLRHSFLIALGLIYVILAGLFRSYVQPMIVMAVIPFGLIGAAIGHYLMDYPLTLLSSIGIVALTGIVVNDSMILVSFINRRVDAGSDVFEAVIEGGKGRLRPILLTSATTVLGIAPLLMETSFQAKFLIPMGISISAGLAFATVLTLVAVPSLYLIVGDFHGILGAIGRWVKGRPVS